MPLPPHNPDDEEASGRSLIEGHPERDEVWVAIFSEVVSEWHSPEELTDKIMPIFRDAVLETCRHAMHLAAAQIREEDEADARS